jgi:HK97 family phage major capsid protein
LTRLWENETDNPQVMPYDPATDTEEIEAARRDMRQKRHKASEYLGQLQKKSNPTGSEVAQMNAMNRAYEDAVEKVAVLERSLNFDTKVDVTNPGAGMRAWGEKVARKIIESRAFDATVGGTMVDPFFDPNLRRLPARNLFVRSVIPVIKADSDKVWYTLQKTRTNNAAPVAAGGLKPSSVLELERKETPIKVIAHIVESLDRSLLSDVPQLTDFLSQELRLGVLLAEESQILTGDGTGQSFLGILSAGITTQALGADSRSDAIYKAITTLRNAFYEPDAVVLNPSDYQDLVLEKTADGEYLHGDPTDSEVGTVWGKQVIASTALTAGTALVGAFAAGCQLWDREAARVDFSDQHSDYFAKNLVLARGEERIAFAVTRPTAFVKITGF